MVKCTSYFTKHATLCEKKKFNIKGDPTYVKALTRVEAANLANNQEKNGKSLEYFH